MKLKKYQFIKQIIKKDRPLAVQLSKLDKLEFSAIGESLTK